MNFTNLRKLLLVVLASAMAEELTVVSTALGQTFVWHGGGRSTSVWNEPIYWTVRCATQFAFDLAGCQDVRESKRQSALIFPDAPLAIAISSRSLLISSKSSDAIMRGFRAVPTDCAHLR